MKPPSSEVPPCDGPRSLLENCASPRCGSHDRARLSTVTSVFAAGWPLVRNRLSTITSCSPSRCLRSRSSFDVRARIHASGPTVVRSCERPSAISSRVHDLSPLAELRAALTFSCSYPRSSFDAHGRFHSVGSQSTGSRVRVTFRRHSLRSSFENRRSTPLTSITPVLILRRSRSRCRTTVPSHDLRPWAETSAIPRPKLTPLPRHPDRPASLDAHDPKALPCSRSRNVSSCFALGFRLELTQIHARVHFTSCDVIEHTHCARSYSAYCHRESLALSSPNSPPCSSF